MTRKVNDKFGRVFAHKIGPINEQIDICANVSYSGFPDSEPDCVIHPFYQVVMPGQRISLRMHSGDFLSIPETAEQEFKVACSEIPKQTFTKEANGLTVEVLLAVALDRLLRLDEKFPCNENKSAAVYIQEALTYLEYRMKSRKKRGVLNTPKV